MKTNSLLVLFGLICFSLTIGVVFVEGRVGTGPSSSVVATGEEGGEGREKKEEENMNRSLQGETTIYKRRGKPTAESVKTKLNTKWGSWKLVDSKSDTRPKNDYYKKYPNRDIPYTKFPANAWQTDTEYLTKFLSESKALLLRSMEAILSEYGFGKFDAAVKGKSFEERSQLIFGSEYLNVTDGKDFKYKKGDKAMETTERSFEGLVRRVLHAIMTEDTFTVVMGGHSAAAGHGNHYQQSYTLQVQKVIEPIFARLGVKATARNIALGGLGTTQNSLGAGSIYGRDIDYLIWDSGMTERSLPAIDLFYRQSILGSTTRVPYLSAPEDRNFFGRLYNQADLDISTFHFPKNIPLTENEAQALTMPWAARYLTCSKEMSDACKANANKYNAICWVDRDDFTPTTVQQKKPGSQVGWHPGNRVHQFSGRVIAFNILNAAYAGINRWIDAQDNKLADEAWHVKDYYNNIRKKLVSVDSNHAPCYANKKLPDEFCKIPFKSRTEFTPRAYPKETSLTSIMELPKIDEVSKWFVPPQSAYEPPDVYIPTLEPPSDAISYIQIVENGVDYVPLLNPKPSPFSDSELSNNLPPKRNKDITPGLGWELNTKASPEKCDGTYDSFCGRSAGNGCLLSGHNDGRHGILFDSFSGWGIFTLKGLQHGIILVKIETWHWHKDISATHGWETIDNKTKSRHLEYDTAEIAMMNNSSSAKMTSKREDIFDNKINENHRRTTTRMSATCDAIEERRTLEEDVANASTDLMGNQRILKAKVENFCDDFRFEYSINGGKIVSLDQFQFCDKQHLAERVVRVIGLLHDSEYTKGKTMDVEIAIRIVGCKGRIVFKLTHIYWA